MSLINEMLNDLEARRGMRTPAGDALLAGVRAVGPERPERRVARWLGALLAGIVGGCIAWYVLGSLERDVARGPASSVVAVPLADAQSAAATSATPPVSAPAALPAPDSVAPAAPVPPRVVDPGTAALVASTADVIAEAAPPAPNAVAEPDAVVMPSSAEPTQTAAPDPPPQVVVDSAPVERPGTLLRVPTASAATPQAELRAILSRLRHDPGARGELVALVTAHPDLVAAREALAADLIRRDDKAGAERVLRIGLARARDEPRYAMMLAHLLVERGQPEAALAILAEARPPARDPGDYLAFVAALEQRLGRHGNAISAYRRALELVPARGAWWVGLGISLAAASETDAAGEAFRRALVDQDLSATLRRYASRELGRLGGNS